MIDFNHDWDEPDIWSTPTHSPLPLAQVPASTVGDPALKPEPTTKPLEASSSASVAASPVSSNDSFHPVQSDIPDEYSNSDPGSSTPVATNLQSYLQSPPEFSLPSELEPSSTDPKFSPPPLAANSWSTSFEQSSNIESAPSRDLFNSNSSSNFDSKLGGFEEFDSHRHYNAQDVNDEDEFGDFDDGEMTTGDDNFGGFSTTSPYPPALRTTPIVPIKLPDQFTEESLCAALAPPLETLFENCPFHPDSSQAWLEEPKQLFQGKKTEPSPSSRIGHVPSILKSDDLQRTWRTLVNDGNKLGAPVEWKRSQIRRLHLVHLGIPVDLNDFLAPPPLPRKSLAIDTKSQILNSNGKLARQSPTISSPFRGPMLDRKRCEELAGISEDILSTKDVEQLDLMCEELKRLNQQALDTLTLKQQQRDRSIQDCQAYNKMISDLVLAAQRIQMASPGSTKRASSINLGSSSISSSSTRWIPLTRSNSHHANATSQPGPTDTPPVNSNVGQPKSATPRLSSS